MCFSSFPLADIFFRSFPTPLSSRGCKDPTQDRRTNVRVKNQEECSDTSTHGSTEPAGPLSSGRILHAFFGSRWRGLGYRLARPRDFHVLSTLPRELTPRLPLKFCDSFLVRDGAAWDITCLWSAPEVFTLFSQLRRTDTSGCLSVLGHFLLEMARAWDTLSVP